MSRFQVQVLAGDQYKNGFINVPGDLGDTPEGARAMADEVPSLGWDPLDTANIAIVDTHARTYEVITGKAQAFEQYHSSNSVGFTLAKVA